jgi:hypothetical protein
VKRSLAGGIPGASRRPSGAARRPSVMAGMGGPPRAGPGHASWIGGMRGAGRRGGGGGE